MKFLPILYCYHLHKSKDLEAKPNSTKPCIALQQQPSRLCQFFSFSHMIGSWRSFRVQLTSQDLLNFTLLSVVLLSGILKVAVFPLIRMITSIFLKSRLVCYCAVIQIAWEWSRYQQAVILCCRHLVNVWHQNSANGIWLK